MSVSARRGLAAAASPTQVLAFRHRCQRLEQRTQEPLAELLSAIAYVPTPGGATPYLSLRARAPRHDRRLVERAVFETGELVDLPFARASSVLAPASDAPFVLAAARRSHEQKVKPLREARLVDERKVPKLFEAIQSALAEGALAADDLRARLPEPLCVPFGEAGRKAGFPSLFTYALRELQLEGQVVRRQREGRLDREGFVWAPPRRPISRDLERNAALAALAGRYFRAFAPSPASAFAFWADLTLGEARTAIADAELATVSVEGAKEPFHLGPEQLDEFLAFEPPVPPRLAFVPFRDPSVSASKDLRGMLPEAHRDKPLADWRGRLVPAGGGNVVHQHFVLLGGVIAGLWEYDPDTRRVRYVTFDQLPTRMRRAADDMADELGQFIATELGAARFYAGEHGEDYGRLEAVLNAWGDDAH